MATELEPGWAVGDRWYERPGARTDAGLGRGDRTRCPQSAGPPRDGQRDGLVSYGRPPGHGEYRQDGEGLGRGDGPGPPDLARTPRRRMGCGLESRWPLAGHRRR